MKEKNGSSNKSVGGLKEVREIIFGDVIAQMQKQIDELKEKNKILNNHIKELESKNSDSSTKIEKLFTLNENSDADLKKLNELVDQNNNSLMDTISKIQKSKIDKNDIGQAFIEWGMKVKQNSDS